MPGCLRWMVGSIALVLACPTGALAQSGLPQSALPQRAIVLVRHAEKADQSKDPPLSPAGVARARALSDFLRDANVTHIVTSEYRRTKATAEPLATRLRIRPEAVASTDVEGLVARLQALAPDAVVLIVGHSNTVPAILTRLGWNGTVVLTEDDYDNAFILLPRAEGAPTVLRLKYGQRSR